MGKNLLKKSAALLFALLTISPPAHADPEDSIRYAANHIWQDQKRMFTSPLKVNRVDLVVWGTAGASLLYLAPEWGQSRSADERIEQGIDRENVSADDFLRSITHIGDAPVLLGASLTSYGVGYWQEWPRVRTASLHVFEGVIDAGIAVQLIKVLAGRRRPVDDPSNGPFLGPWGFFSDSENDSFVSGHAALSFATATIVSHESGTYWVGIPAYVIAGGVSYSRIYVEKHWLSDVIAGAALGYSVGILVETSRHSKPKLAGQFYPYVQGEAVGLGWTKTF